MAKKILVYFLIMVLTAYPASAGDVALNKWVLNVTIHDDGLVEVVIQAEFENGGPSPLDGFSFVVPASRVTILYDQISTIPMSTGQVVEQQTVPGGTKITFNFNKSIDAGNKWNGRFAIKIENWAVKNGSNYSINIPIEAPQAIVSKKNVVMSVPLDAEVRGQVFLPKSVEVISLEPEPFRKLFQYGRIVPTWTPEKLHIGDVIRIKASFSSVLSEIVRVDDRSREITALIKEAKKQGMNVSEAEMHLANANDYNNNQAFASYAKKEYSVVQKFVGYADDELTLAENSLTASKVTPEAKEAKKNPGFEVIALVFILLIGVMAFRKK